LIDYLGSLEADSEAIAGLAPAHLERPVPDCPGWTVAELLRHLGRVYRWAAGAAAGGGQPPPAPGDPPEGDDGLVEWFEAGRTEVLGALRAPEDQPAWSFVPPHTFTVGWWRRRQALETAVHLHDVRSAAGAEGAMDPELAADGIDEFLSAMLPRVLARRPVSALSGTFHVHCTDTPGEWQLDFSAADLDVRREHGKADTAIRGPAAELYLWLWNRPVPNPAIEIFGNHALAEAWREVRL
jgi:uncharacterized protein (TIGR03083 family)